MKENYPNLATKNLLLVVENFGLNFSGGSTATATTFEFFEEVFQKVTILCFKEGDHKLQKTTFHTYENEHDLSLLVDKFSDADTIAFGDFYVANVLVNKGIPYYFVYHDNHPDLEGKHDEMISTYGSIFHQSNHVFSVSAYKLDFIKQFTSKVSLVRNGLSQAVSKFTQRPKAKNKLKVLMAGNIDDRKYRKAVEVFDHLKTANEKGVEIDIYGNSNNERLEHEVKSFDFVTYRGYKKAISYKEYDVYLNTSLAENLSLSVVDSLANKTPVVSFDVGGIKEVVTNLENGVVIPAFETRTMAKTLISIKKTGLSFKMDDKELQQFDWKKSTARMLSIMDSSMQNELIK